MVKVLTNSQGKIYVNQSGKALSTESANTVTAVNLSKSNIYAGDKVWIIKSNGIYKLINFNSFRNFNIVGSPTIDDGTNVISDFTKTDYLETPEAFEPNNQTWEAVFKCILTYEDTTLYEYCLLGYDGMGLYKLFVKPSTRKLNLVLSTSTYSFNIGEIEGQTVLQLNTTYWVKAEFTGTAYNLYLSTDGINYTLEGSVSSSTSVEFPSKTTVGYAFNGGWTGSIDFTETYLSIGGKVWWTAFKSNITQNTLIGYAKEDIAQNATGEVIAILGG